MSLCEGSSLQHPPTQKLEGTTPYVANRLFQNQATKNIFLIVLIIFVSSMSLKTAMENTRKLVATLWDAESYTNKQGQPDRKWFKVGVIQQCDKGLYHVKVRFLGITVWLTGFPPKPKEENPQAVQAQLAKQVVDDLLPF